jgi:hypothetical protein
MGTPSAIAISSAEPVTRNVSETTARSAGSPSARRMLSMMNLS